MHMAPSVPASDCQLCAHVRRLCQSSPPSHLQVADAADSVVRQLHRSNDIIALPLEGGQARGDDAVLVEALSKIFQGQGACARARVQGSMKASNTGKNKQSSTIGSCTGGQYHLPLGVAL